MARPLWKASSHAFFSYKLSTAKVMDLKLLGKMEKQKRSRREILDMPTESSEVRNW